MSDLLRLADELAEAVSQGLCDRAVHEWPMVYDRIWRALQAYQQAKQAVERAGNP